MGWMAPVPGVAMRHTAVPSETRTIGATQMRITTIGLDLAKNIFQICGVTADGAIAFNRPVRRAGLLKFFEKQPPCLVGMEACGCKRSPQHIGGQLPSVLKHRQFKLPRSQPPNSLPRRLLLLRPQGHIQPRRDNNRRTDPDGEAGPEVPNEKAE